MGARRWGHTAWPRRRVCRPQRNDTSTPHCYHPSANYHQSHQSVVPQLSPSTIIARTALAMTSPLMPFVTGAGLLSLFLLFYLLCWWDAPAQRKSRLCPYQHPYALCAVCSRHCLPPPLQAPQPPPTYFVHYRDCTGCPDCPNGDAVQSNGLEISAMWAVSVGVVVLALTALAPLIGIVVAFMVTVAVGSTGRDIRICMPVEDCPCMPDVYSIRVRTRMAVGPSTCSRSPHQVFYTATKRGMCLCSR